MEFRRLAAEILVKGITKDDLGKLLGKSRKAIENRLNGKTSFMFSEVCLIRKIYFPEYSLEYLLSDVKCKFKEDIRR